GRRPGGTTGPRRATIPVNIVEGGFYTSAMTEKRLRVGPSSWSADSWRGPFYPAEAKSGEFLSHYARRFDTVEIDATWYRIPSESMVRKWERDTPEDFVFSAKIPSII